MPLGNYEEYQKQFEANLNLARNNLAKSIAEKDKQLLGGYDINDVNQPIPEDYYKAAPAKGVSGYISQFGSGLGQFAAGAPALAGLAEKAITGKQLKDTYGGAAAQAIEDFTSTESVDPAIRESFSGKVATGLGQATGFLGGALLGGVGKAASAASTAFNLASGMGMGGKALYDDAISKGADEDTAYSAALQGTLLGTTDALPFLSSVTRFLGNNAKGFIRTLGSATITGSEEFIQEGLQTLGENAVAKVTAGYDPDRAWMESVSEAAGVGGATGFIADLVLNTVGKRVRGGPTLKVDKTEEGNLQYSVDPESDLGKAYELSNQKKAEGEKNREKLFDSLDYNNIPNLAAQARGEDTNVYTDQNIAKSAAKLNKYINAIPGSIAAKIREENVRNLATNHIFNPTQDVHKSREAIDALASVGLPVKNIERLRDRFLSEVDKAQEGEDSAAKIKKLQEDYADNLDNLSYPSRPNVEAPTVDSSSADYVNPAQQFTIQDQAEATPTTQETLLFNKNNKPYKTEKNTTYKITSLKKQGITAEAVQLPEGKGWGIRVTGKQQAPVAPVTPVVPQAATLVEITPVQQATAPITEIPPVTPTQDTTQVVEPPTIKQEANKPELILDYPTTGGTAPFSTFDAAQNILNIRKAANKDPKFQNATVVDIPGGFAIQPSTEVTPNGQETSTNANEGQNATLVQSEQGQSTQQGQKQERLLKTAKPKAPRKSKSKEQKANILVNVPFTPIKANESVPVFYNPVGPNPTTGRMRYDGTNYQKELADGSWITPEGREQERLRTDRAVVENLPLAQPGEGTTITTSKTHKEMALEEERKAAIAAREQQRANTVNTIIVKLNEILPDQEKSEIKTQIAKAQDNAIKGNTDTIKEDLNRKYKVDFSFKPKNRLSDPAYLKPSWVEIANGLKTSNDQENQARAVQGSIQEGQESQQTNVEGTSTEAVTGDRVLQAPEILELASPPAVVEPPIEVSVVPIKPSADDLKPKTKAKIVRTPRKPRKPVVEDEEVDEFAETNKSAMKKAYNLDEYYGSDETTMDDLADVGFTPFDDSNIDFNIINAEDRFTGSKNIEETRRQDIEYLNNFISNPGNVHEDIIDLAKEYRDALIEDKNNMQYIGDPKYAITMAISMNYRKKTLVPSLIGKVVSSFNPHNNTNEKWILSGKYVIRGDTTYFQARMSDKDSYSHLPSYEFNEENELLAQSRRAKFSIVKNNQDINAKLPEWVTQYSDIQKRVMWKQMMAAIDKFKNAVYEAGNNDIDFVIYKTREEFLEAVKNDPTLQQNLFNLGDTEPKGWRRRKPNGREEVAILAFKHDSDVDVAKTLLHETVGHYGMEKMFGNRWLKFLERTADTNPKILRQAYNKLAKTYGTLGKKVDGRYKLKDGEYFVTDVNGNNIAVLNTDEVHKLLKEYIAKLSEEYTNPATRARMEKGALAYIKRTYAYLKHIIRSLVNFEVTEEDIHALIRESYARVFKEEGVGLVDMRKLEDISRKNRNLTNEELGTVLPEGRMGYDYVAEVRDYLSGNLSGPDQFSKDMDNQIKWLDERAQGLGFKDTQELMDRDIDSFVNFASQWREQNPLFALHRQELTTKTLSKLPNKPVILRGTIKQLLNQPDVRAADKALINNVLETEFAGVEKIDKQRFIAVVESKLLPLKVNVAHIRTYNNYGLSNIGRDGDSRFGDGQTHVWDAPFNTPANVNHFNDPNYIGHTRTFIGSDNKYYVSEVQSDVAQKAKFDKSKLTATEFKSINSQIGKYSAILDQLFTNYVEDTANIVNKYKDDPIFEDIIVDENNNSIIIGLDIYTIQEAYNKIRERLEDSIQKLKGKTNIRLAPKGYEQFKLVITQRLAREEIKKAAEDGYNEIRFPTGDTASKIESWPSDTSDIYNYDGFDDFIKSLKGKTVYFKGMGKDSWYEATITGEYKFIDERGGTKYPYVETATSFAAPGFSPIHELHLSKTKGDNLNLEKYGFLTRVTKIKPEYQGLFNIYDKELRNFLTKEYNAKEVTDEAGHTWLEVSDISKYASEPVIAFNLNQQISFNAATNPQELADTINEPVENVIAFHEMTKNHEKQIPLLSGFSSFMKKVQKSVDTSTKGVFDLFGNVASSGRLKTHFRNALGYSSPAERLSRQVTKIVFNNPKIGKTENREIREAWLNGSIHDGTFKPAYLNSIQVAALQRLSRELAKIQQDVAEGNFAGVSEETKKKIIDTKGRWLHQDYLSTMDKGYIGHGWLTSALDWQKKRTMPEGSGHLSGAIADSRYSIMNSINLLARDSALLQMYDNIIQDSDKLGTHWVINSKGKHDINGTKYTLQQIRKEINDLESYLNESETVTLLTPQEEVEVQNKLKTLVEAEKVLDSEELLIVREAMIRSGHPYSKLDMSGNPILNDKGIPIGDNLLDLYGEGWQSIVNKYRTDQYVFIHPKKFKNMGNLRGYWLDKRIYDVIFSEADYITNASKNWASTIFNIGPGSTLDRANSLWKGQMTVMNPVYWIRNFLGGGVIMDLASNTNSATLTRYLTEEAHNAFIKEPGESQPLYGGKTLSQWALEKGLFSTGFSANELYAIRYELKKSGATDSFTEMWKKGDYKESAWALGGIMKNGYFELAKTLANLNINLDAMFKMALMRDYLEIHAKQNGFTSATALTNAYNKESKAKLVSLMENAAAYAGKGIFEYHDIPRWMQTLRRVPLGAPFLTFNYKMFGAVQRAALARPWKLIKYQLAGYAIFQALMAGSDWDEEELKKAMDSLPIHMRNKSSLYIIPYKDNTGSVHYADLSYVLPQAFIYDTFLKMANPNPGQSQVGAVGTAIAESTGILSGPIPKVLTAIIAKKDPFTGRDLWVDGDSFDSNLARYSKFMWNLAAPPWAHADLFEAGTGGGIIMDTVNRNFKDEFGKDKNPYWTTDFASLSGANIKTYRPQDQSVRNMRFITSKVKDIEMQRSKVMKNNNLGPEERIAKLRDFAERIKELNLSRSKYSGL